MLNNHLTISEFGALVVIATSAITATRFLYLQFRKAQLRYREKLTGNWTNEGSLGGPVESHYITLSISTDLEDGDVSGDVESRSLEDGSEMKLLFSGRIFFKSVKITFIKISQGRVSKMGTARLTFCKSKQMKWRKIEEYNNFLPHQTVIWRM